jgi:non-ribosomal peptide synthetase component F
MGDGAAAWLHRGGSAQCAPTGSRMPDGSNGGNGDGSVRFFRTGDLGRVDAGSGLLVLGGRLDLQVKIRGVHTMAR